MAGSHMAPVLSTASIDTRMFSMEFSESKILKMSIPDYQSLMLPVLSAS